MVAWHPGWYVSPLIVLSSPHIYVQEMACSRWQFECSLSS